MAFNLIHLTRLNDHDIQELLNNTVVEANQEIVLALLIFANTRFNQGDTIEFNVVRGAAYLKAATAISVDLRDMSTVSRDELLQIRHIGDVIADNILNIVNNRH